jgi:predicted transcriptional regulator
MARLQNRCSSLLTEKRLALEEGASIMRSNRVAEDQTAELSALELAGELTIAWLSNPNTRASVEDVPGFLQSMHTAVSNLAAGPNSKDDAPPAVEFTPAVSVRKSLASRDHIISLIDGKAYKTLKRHLAGHGLTPAQYRERYGLKADYPMVAESYAEHRRNLAKKIGLGRKPGQKVSGAKAASAKPSAAKSAATRAVPAKAKSAKPAAAAKPTQRKKLGVQFETAAAPADQS